jgi:hypothetical protein
MMQMMKKNRTVVLFGAGAVIDWNGPKTYELTKLIRESGFYCTDNETRITEFIFQELVKNGYDEKDINFETIINVIEELIIYYSSFEKNKKTPSLHKTFFYSSFEEILLNFSIEGGIKEDMFSLEIPKGKQFEWQHSGANNGETPEQYFFQLLLAKLLTNINAKISKYAYHTNGNTVLLTEQNDKLNNLYYNWVQSLNPNENALRFYTLNYDRNFKVLGIRSGVGEIFEGFECGETLTPGSKIQPNIPRILTDFDCHCYYNLHGSAFWTVEPRDENQFANAEIFLKGVPGFQINLPEQPYIQIERGKSILISNIITGYQKVQKGFLTPFRQMQTAFDLDCIYANDLYIIGYSFSDEHINMTIKTALIYNFRIRIHIVDPIYDKHEGRKGPDLLINQFLNVFTHYLPKFGEPNQRNDKCCQYFDGKITVYTVGMKEFLKMQTHFNS